jgi:transposase-like protein
MKNLAAFEEAFPTDDACKDYIVAKRWPGGVRCPRCKNEKVFALRTRPYHWVCKSGAESLNLETGKVSICSKNGYRFSVLTATIFQDTKVPLNLWFRVGYLMLTANKGISALQVRRVVFGEDSGTDWRTAWYMCKRWRAAMGGDALPLTGRKVAPPEMRR